MCVRLDYCRIVGEYRKRRIHELGKMYPDVVVAKPPPQTYKASALTRALLNRKVPDHQVFTVNAR